MNIDINNILRATSYYGLCRGEAIMAAMGNGNRKEKH